MKKAFFYILSGLILSFSAEAYEFQNPIFNNALYSVKKGGQALRLYYDQISNLTDGTDRCCVLIEDYKNKQVYECDCHRAGSKKVCQTYYRFTVTGNTVGERRKCEIKRERFNLFHQGKLSHPAGVENFYVWADSCIPYKPLVSGHPKAEIFENLWFYDELTAVDNPRLKVQLLPNAINFQGATPQPCTMMENRDTRVVYRCYHENASSGGYNTYHLFVSAGKDFEGRCLVLSDVKTNPNDLNVGKKPAVFYFNAEDCGEVEDLNEVLMR